MARGMVSTRIDLGQDMDSKLRKVAELEERSKCQMAALLLSRALRLVESEPAKARDLNLIRDSK